MRGLSIIAAAALGIMTLAGPAWAQGRGGGADMLMRADANGDGAITMAEAQNGRAEAFAAMDQNGDGYLTDADRREGQPQGQRQNLGRRADADGDGRISRSEFMNQPYRAFDRFDANNNNVLDANEIARLRQAMSRFGGGT